MSKLSIDQRTVKDLFSDKRSNFLIPDYQRPYAWGIDECRTLWDDLHGFAIPNNGAGVFNRDDEYYLGPIVTFQNRSAQLEVIDGQQRLTTLLLLLRAFYKRSEKMQDDETKSMREMIEQCIWKTNEFGRPDKTQLKIDSQVATDDSKAEFLHILETGEAPGKFASNYALNYRFFEGQIESFIKEYSSYFAFLPARILNNCILLPIEAENQDAALRIFSTLNDRGMPLADADIFKAQFYQYYNNIGKKDEFIARWRDLECLSGEAFRGQYSKSPLDELFTRYMYWRRAEKKVVSTTTNSLRSFYDENSYAILKEDRTLNEIEKLLGFWDCVASQDTKRFSTTTLKRLFILHYAPNGMWRYLLSVYFLKNGVERDISLEEAYFFDDTLFGEFLDRITGFILAYALISPGVSSLRTPIYPEMVNIVEGKEVTFENFKFDRDKLRGVLENFPFSNQKAITRSILTWFAFHCEEQKLLPLESRLDIEHIYARKRHEQEPLSEDALLDALGNKSLLEKNINIRAADYRFADKRNVYLGLSGSRKTPTEIFELRRLAEDNTDFQEADLLARNGLIIDGFVTFLDQCKLLK
jgi:hypothetical protein